MADSAKTYRDGALKAWETRRRNQQRQHSATEAAAHQLAQATIASRSAGVDLGTVLEAVAKCYMTTDDQPAVVRGDLHAIMAEHGCSARAAVSLCQKQTWDYANWLPDGASPSQLAFLEDLRSHLRLVTKQYRNHIAQQRGVLPALIAAPAP